jgi:hypothetical protein
VQCAEHRDRGDRGEAPGWRAFTGYRSPLADPVLSRIAIQPDSCGCSLVEAEDASEPLPSSDAADHCDPIGYLASSATWPLLARDSSSRALSSQLRTSCFAISSRCSDARRRVFDFADRTDG